MKYYNCIINNIIIESIYVISLISIEIGIGLYYLPVGNRLIYLAFEFLIGGVL